MNNKFFPAPMETNYSVAMETPRERQIRKHEPHQQQPSHKVSYMYNVYVYEMPQIGKICVLQRTENEAYGMIQKQYPMLASVVPSAYIDNTISTQFSTPTIWRIKP